MVTEEGARKVNTAAIINRRVEVENLLFMIAAGKKALPTREDCFKIAVRLGTPKEMWSDIIKELDCDKV